MSRITVKGIAFCPITEPQKVMGHFSFKEVLSDYESTGFHLTKLPDHIVGLILLYIQDLETYKRLATIDFFVPFLENKFIRHIILDSIAHADIPSRHFSGINLPTPLAHLSPVPPDKTSKEPTPDISDYKFYIIQITKTLFKDHTPSLKWVCKMLTEKKKLYFIEVNCFGAIDMTSFLSFADIVGPYFKGYYLKNAQTVTNFGQVSIGETTPNTPGHLVNPGNFTVSCDDHSINYVDALQLHHSSNAAQYLPHLFGSQPILKLSASVCSVKSLDVFKPNFSYLRGLEINSALCQEHESLPLNVFDGLVFPVLEKLFINSLRSIYFRDSQFPKLKLLSFTDSLVSSLNSGEEGQVKKSISIKNCSFPQLLSLDLSSFHKINLKLVTGENVKTIFLNHATDIFGKRSSINLEGCFFPSLESMGFKLVTSPKLPSVVAAKTSVSAADHVSVNTNTSTASRANAAPNPVNTTASATTSTTVNTSANTAASTTANTTTNTAANITAGATTRVTDNNTRNTVWSSPAPQPRQGVNFYGYATPPTAATNVSVPVSTTGTSS